jgi:hypothetical protein
MIGRSLSLPIRIPTKGFFIRFPFMVKTEALSYSMTFFVTHPFRVDMFYNIKKLMSFSQENKKP